MARLIIHHDDTFIAEVELDRPVMSIGRRASNDIVLSGDAAVSGAHAQIRVDGDSLTVEDLQSTNGTRVNNTPTTRQAVSEDDVIVIGSHRLRIAASAGAEATLIMGPGDGLEELSWPEEEAASAPLGPGQLVPCASSAPTTPIPLERPLTTIGDPTAQLAAVARRPDGYYALCITARGNSEARVNQQALTRALVRLSSGDVITVGDSQLRFEMLPTPDAALN